MNRRDFLKALGVTFAAAAVPSAVLKAVEVVPVVDWTAWNHVELKSGLAGVTAWVNGVDVTNHPSILRVINRFVHIGKDAIRFGASGFEEGDGEPAVRRSGFMMPLDNPDSTETLFVGCSLHLPASGKNTISDLWTADKIPLDADMDASRGKNAIILKPIPGSAGVRIEARYPSTESDKAIAEQWVPTKWTPVD